MSRIYDEDLIESALMCAKISITKLNRVCMGIQRSIFETPAEIKALRALERCGRYVNCT